MGGEAALPANLQSIVMAFQMVPDPMQRYKQLLFYASKLEALPADDHIEENKVQGCVSQVRPMCRQYLRMIHTFLLLELPWNESKLLTPPDTEQVWVKPTIKEDGKIYWQADSDSQLTKGLAALLVKGLSGCTPQEICSVTPDFIEMLGLKQSLTPSRNNGFLNMLKLMQKKSLALAAAQAASQ